MTFLSMAALMFVGVTPAFNDSKMEGKIHDVAAYICAAFATLWIILVTPYWYVLLIMLIVIGAVAYVTKTWKTAYIFWLENVVLISAFISMLAYYEQFVK